jgi:hypothetical protein
LDIPAQACQLYLLVSCLLDVTPYCSRSSSFAEPFVTLTRVILIAGFVERFIAPRVATRIRHINASLTTNA